MIPSKPGAAQPRKVLTSTGLRQDRHTENYFLIVKTYLLKRLGNLGQADREIVGNVQSLDNVVIHTEKALSMIETYLLQRLGKLGDTKNDIARNVQSLEKMMRLLLTYSVSR